MNLSYFSPSSTKGADDGFEFVYCVYESTHSHVSESLSRHSQFRNWKFSSILKFMTYRCFSNCQRPWKLLFCFCFFFQSSFLLLSTCLLFPNMMLKSKEHQIIYNLQLQSSHDLNHTNTRQNMSLSYHVKNMTSHYKSEGWETVGLTTKRHFNRN